MPAVPARMVAVAVAAAIGGATLGPSAVEAAKKAVTKVVITNSARNPVNVRAVGTTTVAGKVDATGSKVDASGSTVGIAGKVDASGSKVDASGSTVGVTGKVDVSGSAVDASGSTVKLDASGNQVRPVPVPYTATVRVVPASGDARTCLQVPLPASGTVQLQSVVVTDYFSPTVPIAYVKPYVKTGSATGQVTQARVDLTASEPDPTSNMRTGVLDLPLTIAGGGFNGAAIGEVYDLYACINHVSGESAQANFVFTGTALPDGSGVVPVAKSAAKAAPAATGSAVAYGPR